MEFERAASMTRNEREKKLLLARAAVCNSLIQAIPGSRNSKVAPPSSE